MTLRFELDTLVVLSSVPHPLDPATAVVTAAGRAARSSASTRARATDAVRRACEENERGFAATRGGAAMSVDAAFRRARG